MPTAQTIYLGQLRTESTHLHSGTRLVTDAPLDNKGRGEAFSPTDLLATALGTCMLTIMGIQAEHLGIDLTGSELAITKGMSAQPPRKVARVEITLRMQTAEPLEEGQREHLEHAAHTCPVALSLHPDVVQALTFEWRVSERV